ncbi:hypothetical protein QKT49_gp176 [Acanthamoeba castellanii medusavirus]|uniref:Fibronectin type III domain-containing protein n=1 Tax=Acanthamoeba castellanii medusavirus J1 TaxID=3114988 RepID=A0A3T1CXL0_9VIRU|nr:hypothetical protein QKT49_gp176 [Acanthamoeba castellanii medusavirus]BBI30587.1 hypothetical protein [Acanthamoeba castellanii medusavirus J1]
MHQRLLLGGIALVVAAVAIYFVFVRRASPPPVGKIGPVRNIKLATATTGWMFAWDEPADVAPHQVVTYGYTMTSPRGDSRRGTVSKTYALLPADPAIGEWSISVWANDPAGIAGPTTMQHDTVAITPGAPVNLRATPNDSDGFLIQWDAPPGSDPKDLSYDTTMVRPDGMTADSATGITTTSRTTGSFRPRISGTWIVAAIARNATAESNVAHATVTV